MRREYVEVISLSTASLDAHFWDLNAYANQMPSFHVAELYV
jgi:hypothetical protein